MASWAEPPVFGAPVSLAVMGPGGLERACVAAARSRGCAGPRRFDPEGQPRLRPQPQAPQLRLQELPERLARLSFPGVRRLALPASPCGGASRLNELGCKCARHLPSGRWRTCAPGAAALWGSGSRSRHSLSSAPSRSLSGSWGEG